MNIIELSNKQPGEKQTNPLPLLDYQSGLARAVDDPALYTQLLTIFRERFTGSNVRVATLIDEGKLDEAGKLLHNMKGSAATISADLLSIKCAELEKTIKQPPPIEIRAFTETLEKTLEIIKDYINGPG